VAPRARTITALWPARPQQPATLRQHHGPQADSNKNYRYPGRGNGYDLPRAGRIGRADSYTFQVDLRGLVDLLSQHLYSSPRVYVRELRQNAVDATTARRQADPVGSAPPGITISIGDVGLEIADSGIGLTEAEAHRFLATIGNSSKRDDLAGGRSCHRC